MLKLAIIVGLWLPPQAYAESWSGFNQGMVHTLSGIEFIVSLILYPLMLKQQGNQPLILYLLAPLWVIMGLVLAELLPLANHVLEIINLVVWLTLGILLTAGKQWPMEYVVPLAALPMICLGALNKAELTTTGDPLSFTIGLLLVSILLPASIAVILQPIPHTVYNFSSRIIGSWIISISLIALSLN